MTNQDTLARIAKLEKEAEIRIKTFHGQVELNRKAHKRIEKLREALEKIKNHDGHRHSEDTDYTAEKALLKDDELNKGN